MMSSSPDRDTFQARAAQQRAESGETSADNADALAEIFKTSKQRRLEREQDPEWQKNNMEYDMRSSDWMTSKVRASDAYAQNLYAAMCNNEFRQNDVWPLLTDQNWSCSWRYAGGIVADMRGQGDYMDWYCSGIGGVIGGGSEYDPEIEKAQLARQGFVSEATVTEEIRQDLFNLGWLVVEEKNIDYT